MVAVEAVDAAVVDGDAAVPDRSTFPLQNARVALNLTALNIDPVRSSARDSPGAARRIDSVLIDGRHPRSVAADVVDSGTTACGARRAPAGALSAAAMERVATEHACERPRRDMVVSGDGGEPRWMTCVPSTRSPNGLSNICSTVPRDRRRPGQSLGDDTSLWTSKARGGVVHVTRHPPVRFNPRIAFVSKGINND